MGRTVSMFEAFIGLGQECLLMGREPWEKRPFDAADILAEHAEKAGVAIGLELEDSARRAMLSHTLIAGVWASCGFPTVQLGHKTAAAFCGTSLTAKTAEECVRPPWPAFAIRLPTPFLVIESDASLIDANLLMVCALDAEVIPGPSAEPGLHWWYSLITTAPVPSALDLSRFSPSKLVFLANLSLWKFNVLTSHFGGPSEYEDADGFERWLQIPRTAVDTRTELMMSQLIASTCLQLCGDPRKLSEEAYGDEEVTIKRRASKAKDGIPSHDLWEVESAIRVNLAPNVREFILKGGKSPKVRTMVGGHWKRQVHGEGRALRKVIHVMPYKRGPLDGPQAMRIK